MRTIISLFVLSIIAATVIACNDTSASPGEPASSPTDGYKKLYAAVKSKNTELIKAHVSKKTHDLAQMVSSKNNTPIEKVYENGFTATTFAETLPEIRDERVNGDMGNVEVWNAKDKRWEDLPFILEDGSWRLAVGDMFAGTFKSPGKGRAMKEAEAANILSNNNSGVQPPNANINGNFSSAPKPPATSESSNR